MNSPSLLLAAHGNGKRAYRVTSVNTSPITRFYSIGKRKQWLMCNKPTLKSTPGSRLHHRPVTSYSNFIKPPEAQDLSALMNRIALAGTFIVSAALVNGRRPDLPETLMCRRTVKRWMSTLMMFYLGIQASGLVCRLASEEMENHTTFRKTVLLVAILLL